MKRCRQAHLLVLIIGFAISSPKVMAQLTPAADLPHLGTVAGRPSSVAVQPGPILIYTRPTEREKLQLFEFDAFGPYAFAKATFAGGFQQATREPPEWGTGWDAFGVRVASSFGIQLVTTTARYGMAEILHEDAAYYRCECKGSFPAPATRWSPLSWGATAKTVNMNFPIQGWSRRTLARCRRSPGIQVASV